MKVIYYPEIRVRFFCQNKNASTSMEAYFSGLTDKKIVHWDRSTLEPRAPWSHPFKEIAESPADLEFTIVRNTWDRLASMYRMFLLQRKKFEGGINPWFHRYSGPILAALDSVDPFATFVKFVCGQSDAQMDTHWQHQTYRLPFHSPIFHVIRFERLPEDLKRIGGVLGAIESNGLVHRNKTDGEGYRQLYTEETRELVRARYWKEIELFGFDF